MSENSEAFNDNREQKQPSRQQQQHDGLVGHLSSVVYIVYCLYVAT